MANLVIKSALFSALFLSVALNISYSQTFFGTSPGSTDTSTTKAPVQVMSPDDFKNAVTKRSQQMKSNAVQQSDQFMKAPAPAAATTPAAPSAAPAGTEMTTTPPGQTGTTAAPSPTALPPMQTPPTMPAAAPAQQQDVYTGFGPAQSNVPSSKSTSKPASPSNSGSSGGWNIKY